jgi:hypothetical protein
MSDTVALPLSETVPAPSVDASARIAARQFMTLITLATVGPWLAIPLMVSWHAHANVRQLQSVIVFIGSGVHVAASYYFYVDPAARESVRAHRGRFLYAPALLVVLTAIVFAFSSDTARFSVLLAYLSWQTYHYMRQNIGVFAFITKARRSVAPSKVERYAITASGYAAILGMLVKATPYQKTPLDGTGGLLRVGSVAAYAVAGALLFVSLARSRRAVKDPARTAAFVACVGFFLPVLIYHDPISATLSYAIAHGFQYLVFMWFVAGRRTATSAGWLMGVAAALTLGGGFLVDRMNHANFKTAVTGAIFGAYLGIVMTHFVLDAGIWRLRDPRQRAYMKERFGFL